MLLLIVSVRGSTVQLSAILHHAEKVFCIVLHSQVPCDLLPGFPVIKRLVAPLRWVLFKSSPGQHQRRKLTIRRCALVCLCFLYEFLGLMQDAAAVPPN